MKTLENTPYILTLSFFTHYADRDVYSYFLSFFRELKFEIAQRLGTLDRFYRSFSAIVDTIRWTRNLELKFFSTNIRIKFPKSREPKFGRVFHSTPWANIITSPGSDIMSSSTVGLSTCSTTTACLQGIRLQTYFSYSRRLLCRVSSDESPGGQLRSWQFSMSSSRMCDGHPLSISATFIVLCEVKLYFNKDAFTLANKTMANKHGE